MTRISKISTCLPAVVERTLVHLGHNIRVARLRRRLRLQDLAERVGVSRFLMSDIEKGKPSIAIAAYIGALWAMGLTENFENIADPDHDAEGKILEDARAPKTAPKRKKALDNDF